MAEQANFSDTAGLRGDAAGWRPSMHAVLLWAVWIALMMSAQLLFQPFVWRNWPWDEVLQAWLELACRRLEVALAIAFALMGAWALPARSLGIRAALLASAIVVAAVGAEAAISGQPDFGERGPTTRLLTWGVVASSVAGMFYLWRRGAVARQSAQALQLRHVQMQQQLTQLKLQALRSQIEPHFLFNTLATVRSLRGTEPARGERLLTHLIAYLRATGSASPSGATLGAEIDIIRAYLGVVEMRMSDRIAVSIDVPDELLDYAIPSLAVATLVENAVKHGLAPKPDGGTVCVSARRQGDFLEVSVADDGVGFAGVAGSGGTGIGLANVRARLRTLHGDQAALLIRANETAGALVTVVVPFVKVRS